MWLFYYLILKGILFVEQKYKFNKKETESKMKNPVHGFRETNPVLQLI